MSDVRCVVPCRNVLGEGPLWCPEERVLWWVDIGKPSLWRLDPRTGEAAHWLLPKPMGSFALRRGGGFLFAFRSGLATLSAPGAEPRFIECTGVQLGEDRFNDGKCDRAGRFWCGTLDRKVKRPLGVLYRIASLQEASAVDRGFTVSNGIGWSPEGTTMYFAETISRTIYAYDFNLAGGAVSNRRVFAQMVPGEGGPDGLTVDAEGGVWSAQVGRWCLHRYDARGRLDAVIKLPVEKPTSVMFGGDGLKTLFVTSLSMEIGDDTRQPQAGGLFAFEPGVTGIPEPRFSA